MDPSISNSESLWTFQIPNQLREKGTSIASANSGKAADPNNDVASCDCFGYDSDPEAFAFHWRRVVFFIAEVCLLAGSVQNAYHTKYVSSLSNDSCRTLRKGVFGAGAAFIVFTGILSELYYVSYSKASNLSPTYGGDTGVRMGNL